MAPRWPSKACWSTWRNARPGAAWRDLPETLQADWTSPQQHRFGIPTGVATTLIYYNRDMFERAGINQLPTQR